MRSLRTVLTVVPVLAVALVLFAPRTAHTLPVFARKYSVPCTTCHLAFPRLNAFGMAFRQNGYRMAGAHGESPWESQNFPLSLVGNVGYEFSDTNVVIDPAAGTQERHALSAFVQNAVEFHSAGTLGPNMSFHFDNNFAGVNGPLQSGMAFIQFDDIAKDGGLNLKAGIYDADIPYLADSRRTTLSHYLSPVTLDGEGVEANGKNNGWTYAVGLINSARTHGSSTDKVLNNMENIYVWLMRDIGGQLVTARIYLDNQDPRSTATGGSSRHTQAELNAFFNHGTWILIPGVTYEEFADADLTQRDKVTTALLETMIKLEDSGRWWFTGRYELQHSPTFMFQGAEAFPEQDVAAIAANLSCMLNPNARLAFEYNRLTNNVQAPALDQIDVYVHVAY